MIIYFSEKIMHAKKENHENLVVEVTENQESEKVSATANCDRANHSAPPPQCRLAKLALSAWGEGRARNTRFLKHSPIAKFNSHFKSEQN